MKRLICTILTVVAFVAIAITPAQADPDLAVGEKVFNSNCAACHKGGMNVVMAPKNLQKASLEKYSMASMEAIMTQVTNGKGGMPAFGGKLDGNQIESVAAYVLSQADAGWK